MTDRARKLNAAIALWREGCNAGMAGECPECNAAFLRAIDQLINAATAESFDTLLPTTDNVGHA